MNESNGVSILKRDYPGIEWDAVALSLHLKEQFSGLLNEELSRLIAERCIEFTRKNSSAIDAETFYKQHWIARVGSPTDERQYQEFLRFATEYAAYISNPDAPRCPCCHSMNVVLMSNNISRWVACHNPPCGLTHHVSMHPELARFFEKEKQL